MKRNDFFYVILFFITSGLTLISCGDNDDPDIEPELTVTHGAYILNSGLWGANSSSLDFFDIEKKAVNENVYKTQNGRDLGDTANDMLIYGSKIYIAVNVSNTIEVTDLTGKLIQTIVPTNDGSKIAGPRYLAAHRGKVYVSLLDGFVARIDTTNLYIETKVEVGVGADEMYVEGDKLYTSISSYPPYKSSKVKEIDLLTFSLTKEYDVIDNPTNIYVDRSGYMYVLSAGVEPDFSNKLVRFDPKTGEKKELISNGKVTFTAYKDHLYVISTKTENWNPVETKFLRYNLTTQSFETEQFVSSDVVIKNSAYVDIEPSTGDAYILTGYTIETGDLYIVSKEGKLINKVGLSSANPVCTRFVTIEQ